MDYFRFVPLPLPVIKYSLDRSLPVVVVVVVVAFVIVVAVGEQIELAFQREWKRVQQLRESSVDLHHFDLVVRRFVLSQLEVFYLED